MAESLSISASSSGTRIAKIVEMAFCFVKLSGKGSTRRTYDQFSICDSTFELKLSIENKVKHYLVTVIRYLQHG